MPLSRLQELQADFMQQHDLMINSRPGLTEETRTWEDRLKHDFYHLQVASILLHQTMSADSVAAVLLEGTTLIQTTLSLLTNIGVGDKVEQAAELIQAANKAGADRPNLLPLVLDKN